MLYILRVVNNDKNLPRDSTMKSKTQTIPTKAYLLRLQSSAQLYLEYIYIYEYTRARSTR